MSSHDKLIVDWFKYIDPNDWKHSFGDILPLNPKTAHAKLELDEFRNLDSSDQKPDFEAIFVIFERKWKAKNCTYL